MTRTLVLIAFSGFILAVACIAGAFALGGNVLLHHHWGRHWNVEWNDDHRHSVADGASASREIAWPGGSSIEFDVPGDVQYTQAPGPAKLVISGPKDEIDRVVLSDGALHSDDDFDFGDSRISVTMTAPDVRHFAINGDNSLVIDSYNQDDFAVDVSGNGKVSAKGKTRAIKLDVSGNGDIDLSGLAAQSADAQISGSGRASMAPTDEANVSISGSGEIDLLTHPPKLNTDVSGSGRVIEDGAAPAPASASSPPAQLPTPPAPPPPKAR
ncbi:MAG TPA: DUF2807 domain-containing protein [Caulobacteraceae bacterium]|jgi:hypothetical protein|nr:DUF2807 domain-containing protein [Caulobacteraceae bacterium]